MWAYPDTSVKPRQNGLRGQIMTNYAGTDVIRLFGINHPDEIESDSQYQTGHITAKVGNKVRIEWNQDEKVEFLNTVKLHKLDKETFWLNADNTDEAVQTELKREETEEPDENDNSGNPDNFPVSVENVSVAALSAQLGTLLTPAKNGRKPRTTRKVPETVKVDNVVTSGNGD
jgi:hypothetical protein